VQYSKVKQKTKEASDLLKQMGVPCLIHQPSYSMLNRWIEADLLDTLGQEGIGCIAFSPLAQGLLTERYLKGIPEDARVKHAGSFSKSMLSESNLKKVKALNKIAKARGQSLAQLALAWVLRDKRITSALIGASSVKQLEDNVGALKNLELSQEELKEIDKYATESGINLWDSSHLAG
jgi:L-glyceraldehyde 3-phosphate reductase